MSIPLLLEMMISTPAHSFAMDSLYFPHTT